MAIKTKSYLYQMAICLVVIIIGITTGVYYYDNYIKPTSYVNGEVTAEPYESLKFNDYVTNESILFSQNLSGVAFTNTTDNLSIYQFTFEPIIFDGTQNNYAIYVNDYLTSNVSQSAGAITGYSTLKFYDIDKSVLAVCDIKISFASYSKSTLLQVSFDTKYLALMMKHLQNNDMIITLTKPLFGENNMFLANTTTPEEPVENDCIGKVITINFENAELLSEATNIKSINYTTLSQEITDYYTYTPEGSSSVSLIPNYKELFSQNITITPEEIMANNTVKVDYLYCKPVTTDTIIVDGVEKNTKADFINTLPIMTLQ